MHFHFLDDFPQDAVAAGSITTVFVIAQVGQRRQEFAEQVAMGSVNFQHIEPGFPSAHGLAIKKFHQLWNFFYGNLTRNGTVESERDRRKSNSRHSWQIGISARMPDLGTNFCTETVEQVHQTTQACDVIITPDAEVSTRDADIGMHCQSLQKNQSYLALGTAP